MIKTEFFNDFVNYYNKAKTLQDRNLLIHDNLTGDPIMDNITIYDTVNRKYAGFSKVLEDIHGVRSRKDLIRLPDYSQVLDSKQFHFLHLFHRFTGSGASFQPRLLPNGELNPKEHGYCNNIVDILASAFEMCGDYDVVKSMIVDYNKPMVTSTGNQPPSLKNGDPSKYRLALQYYFDNFSVQFVTDYLTFLMNNEYKNNAPTGIKEAVDFCCGWHKDKGFKQWHFVLTAFVMDTAEYYPELVDPKSHCYYGANCVRSFDLMFVKEQSDPKKKDQFQELCMTELCKATGGNPYDIEDVCCDYIRYLVEYVPKGYEHLTPEQTKNNCSLKVNGEYPLEIQAKIKEIIG